LRREIISDHSAELSDGEVEELAERTRGLYEPDIEKSVESYLQTGRFPEPPDHPTNTCNPKTGNWAEHLMNPYDVAEWFRESEFEEVSVLRKGYPTDFTGVKKAAAVLQNVAIGVSTGVGLRFSPCYGIHAKKAQ
jgi:hypothetical protein